MNPQTNTKILLVDDDNLVRDVYRRLLGRHFNVSLACGAREALDLLAAGGPFAVVMSDFRMPGLSGLELLRHVRSDWPQTSRILLSGQLEIAEMSGDDDLARVIGKPYPHSELIQVLRQAIDEYNLKTCAVTAS